MLVNHPSPKYFGSKDNSIFAIEFANNSTIPYLSGPDIKKTINDLYAIKMAVGSSSPSLPGSL